jgi:predicted ATPase
MTVTCSCTSEHSPRRIVVTGGPGAGKTALLELLRHAVCRHVHILPESAGVVFGGGFPREEDPACRRASQRAIFHVQRELEVVGDAHRPAIVLCDRGTVDGVAYWPGDPADFWASVHTDPRRELGRYGAVIHLRTPPPGRGYNHRNPLRTESPEAAAEIDERILQAWSDHPRRFVIESSPRFVDKAVQALEILHAELPECCAHAPELHR